MIGIRKLYFFLIEYEIDVNEHIWFIDFADTDIVKFIKSVEINTCDVINSLIDLNEGKICLKALEDYFELFLS